MIGGVCSGLGEFFGVDPLLARIVFVVLALVPPGIGLLLYLLLWILMPEQPQEDVSLGTTVRSGVGSMASDVRRIGRELGVTKRQTQ